MNLRIDAIKLNDLIEAFDKEIKDLTNAYNEKYFAKDYIRIL